MATKNLLIVCPRFPPINAADGHRVRLSLPFYAANGWDATVLSVEDRGAPEDRMLLQSLPEESRVVRIKIWPEAVCRKIGFGQLDYRSLVPLFVSGMRLLRRKKYDVVLFSTTVFLSFILGPIWKAIYGCKIVYDYQDPWYYGNKQPYTKQTVPGAWWKFRLGQAIAHLLEPIALRSADHIISVSEGYVEALCGRYSFLSKELFTVLPFPASKRDYEFVEQEQITQSVFAPDGRSHWVYAGRGGHDMHLALNALFAELAALTESYPDLHSALRIHFVGTSYAPPGGAVKSIEPIALKFGIADMIDEQPERIPYFEALALYINSDLVLMIGSEMSDYTASKLFNCVLSQRKVLALFHRDSVVTNLVKNLPCVFLATFGPQIERAAFEEEVRRGLKWALADENYRPCDERSLSPWLADASTKIQCDIFGRLVFSQNAVEIRDELPRSRSAH
jgi:hypothetical protein